jgi:hypothetical protein
MKRHHDRALLARHFLGGESATPKPLPHPPASLARRAPNTQRIHHARLIQYWPGPAGGFLGRSSKPPVNLFHRLTIGRRRLFSQKVSNVTP